MTLFYCNEKVTAERKTTARDSHYGTEIEAWEAVAANYWAHLQDELPIPAQLVKSDLRRPVLSTRLRMHRNLEITAGMRVTLHNRGDRVMKIIAGPALLEDGVHAEWMLEEYTHD